jgi:cytochrome c-type biogenesis protein CcmH/NrfG
MPRTTRPAVNTVSPMNAVVGTAGIFLGVIVGYVIGAGNAQGNAAAVAAADPHVHTSQAAPVVNEAELQAYRTILQSDPKNLKANVELANRLYDAGRFADAIPYYQQAFALDARNVNVSTDLGTAMYYAGRTDEGLKQLEKSLGIDPAHAQTWFNIGIIRRDAKGDKVGAVAAWEKLLEVAPNYPEAARVRTLISEAKPQAAAR